MNPKQLAGNDLRGAVFEIVARELGPAALVRYIAENFSQPGQDYTANRSLFPSASVADIAEEIKRWREEQGR
jgi:hypothetical protein